MYLVYFVGIFLLIMAGAYLVQRTRATNVPKIVWSYWDKNPPKSVEQIQTNNRNKLKGWSYRFCTAETLKQYIDPSKFPEAYQTLKPQHQADYIRLALLKEYGGVWLDSSIIINSAEALNRIRREVEATRSELGIFTLGEPEESYVENWFIMAPKYSPILDEWFVEYDIAVRKGFHVYKQEVFARGININEGIYKQTDKEVYLTQHACFQAVLQKRGHSQRKLCMYKSEESMFKLHIDCDWKTSCIKHKLETDGKKLQRLPFIKLRGGDRGEDLSAYFRFS